ncbi:hypothetical protein CPB85DRAFT_348549 [Mucidula mucida]|nr:hypothetical protein CPB85DRAFT_348549 [Mucidula mucida]
MSTRIPPNLLYLTIYNPTLTPSDPTAVDDDEDAEEQAHILFYTSKERAVSRDRMLRQIGLAKALINFSEIFTAEDQCNNVHSQGRRMIMVSPEPDFCVHACVELAKRTRPPTLSRSKGKDKSKSATIGRSTGKDTALVTEYDESSVDDIALREDISRGYEQFKLKHGSMTHILASLGQQALELQLERFFTPWAWSWEIEEANIFGRHLGAPINPKHRPITQLLDATCPQIPSIIITPLYVIPSTSFTQAHYPTSLPRLISTLLPPPSSPLIPEEPLGDTHPNSDLNEGRVAPSTFLGMPSMNLNMNMSLKLNWPGYLTFKGKRAEQTSPSSTPPPDPTIEYAGTEQRPEDAIVDKQALDDAINSESRPPSDLPVEGDNVSTNTLLSGAEDQLQPPSPLSPRPSSDTSSLKAPPSPIPPPELSSIAVHLAPPDNPLQTELTTINFLPRYPVLLAFIGSVPPSPSEVQVLCNDALNILDEDSLRSSSSETLPTAAKILQPKDRHIISKGTGFTHSNEVFESKGEQLYVAQKLFESDPDIREVFSRGVNPQYWHIAKRGWTEEADGQIYMEVLRKETTLSDVDNVMIGALRKLAASNVEAEVLPSVTETA